MIIMINGAFGAGKTTVATQLLQSIPNSMLYDPEEVGYMLRSLIPEELKDAAERTGDFQDLEIWKVLTVQVAQAIMGKYRRNLIVPMTIHNRIYFQYIVRGFREIDPDTYHFCLIASEETIHNRLRLRGEQEGNWCFQQTKKCVEAHLDPCFAEFVLTDAIPVDQIVNQIENSLRGRIC